MRLARIQHRTITRLRRGMAVVLVLIAMAIAGLLAAAMLTGSALQANSSANAVSAAIAKAEAESGIHLAIYYLMNPTYAPTYGANVFWPGGSGITFSTPGSGGVTMPGNVSVTVTNPATNVYNITALGSSDTSSGTAVISRTITAQVQLKEAYVINEAAGVNSPVAVRSGMNFSGSPTALASSAAVTISGGFVTGNIDAASVSGGVPILGTINAAPSSPPAPTAGTVTNYTQAYTYQGQTYSPTLLTATVTSATLQPTSSNPLGIFYYPGNLKITGTVNISGTLVVTGNFTDNGSVNVTAPPGQPGVVVNNLITMQGANKNLTVNGVAYAGAGISGSSSATSTSININGALLLTTGGFASSYLGGLSVTYNASNTTLANFSSSNQTVIGWQISSWSE